MNIFPSLRFGAVPQGELGVDHLKLRDGLSDLQEVDEGEYVAQVPGVHLRRAEAGRTVGGEEGRGGGGVGLAPRPVLHLIS